MFSDRVCQQSSGKWRYVSDRETGSETKIKSIDGVKKYNKEKSLPRLVNPWQALFDI